MLELAILGLLKEQELHGYELKKRLSDTLGFGTVVGAACPSGPCTRPCAGWSRPAR